jgi:hypothetical protein
MPKTSNNTLSINSTYEDIAIDEVAPLPVYQPLKYNQGLQYDGWYAYSYPEELQYLPVPRPYGRIVTVANNGSTITPVHLYSEFATITTISAAFAIILDTNLITAIPVQGTVIVKAYKMTRPEEELVLISEASCPLRMDACGENS